MIGDIKPKKLEEVRACVCVCARSRAVVPAWPQGLRVSQRTVPPPPFSMYACDQPPRVHVADPRPHRQVAGEGAASASAGASAPVAASAAAAAAASTPVLLPEAATPSLAAASVWNKAGTFEERDLSSWFKGRVTDAVVSPATSADIGVGELVVTGVNDWEGSASIMILRGKPRKLYDVKFKVRWGEGGGG